MKNPSFEYDPCDVYDGFYFLIDSLASLMDHTVPLTRLSNDRNKSPVDENVPRTHIANLHNDRHMVVHLPEEGPNQQCTFKELLELQLGNEVRS